ncbi:hypothetical protein [Micrococcus luteus]|uniref:hypothetical protein n=1 Tax=Micrococcus luteus TaxID=1270 RepID=UPI0021B161AC|nr:hypothetical protein [Micrococcus luteus]
MERIPTSLKELAQLVFDMQGTSARQVAQRAEKRGYRLTHTTINQMRAGTYKSVPKEETLRALADLAGVSVETAFHAAGLPVPGPPLADELPPGSDNLSPKSRAAVIQMLRVLIDLESNHDEHDHPDQHQDRERRTAKRGGARGGDAGAEQKTAAAGAPADFDLAAHPDFELTRDRQAREWGDVGEENQDMGEEGGA